MQSKALSLLAVSALFLSFLTGCGGNGVRVTEGNTQIGSAPSGTLYATDKASVVHIDEFERIATLRNARTYAEGAFLQASDRKGNKTGILKVRAMREGLRTADVLEGSPAINNTAVAVSASESARLEKIYRDPVAE